MNEEMMSRSYEAWVEGESLGYYTAKTLGWMFAGLLIAFVAAMGGYMIRAIAYAYAIPYWHYILLATELGAMVFLSARTEKMFVGVARALFLLYAALNGIVFCAYLIVSDLITLWTVSGITPVFLGIMVLAGWFGNISFAKIHPSMMGGLIFLVFFWLLVVFIDLSAFETTVPMIGIFPFLIFTAYNIKEIQTYHVYYGQVPEMAAKTSIFAALQLHPDFINLFIYLLRVLGRRKS